MDLLFFVSGIAVWQLGILYGSAELAVVSTAYQKWAVSRCFRGLARGVGVSTAGPVLGRDVGWIDVHREAKAMLGGAGTFRHLDFLVRRHSVEESQFLWGSSS